MKLLFHKAYQFTHKWEKGYSNHPADRGGSTMHGVTQRAYDAYTKKKGLPQKDVRDLRMMEIIHFYHEEYWKDEWMELGFPLAVCMFDTAVNMGMSRADAFLKKCNGSYVEFLQLRIAFYKRIIEKTPSQKVFEKGWMNRVTDLRRYIEVEKDEHK